MAEKILNTRIRSKIDTLENWNKSDLILLEGEIAIATTAVDGEDNVEGLQEPVYMIKIGDGSNTFKGLKWNVYAKASDVLTACKTEETLKEFILDTVEAHAGITETLNEAIGSLDYSDSAENGYYVSSVSQADGIISVTKEALPNFLTNLKIEIGEVEGKKHNIIIKDGEDKIISSVDASTFVKDGMLQSASYDKSTHKLTLKWNADSDVESDTVIELDELMNVYSAGEGISIGDTGTISLSEDAVEAIRYGSEAIQEITTNDVSENNPSGLIATKGEDNKYNIAIDDSVTFIFNCGNAEVNV